MAYAVLLVALAAIVCGAAAKKIPMPKGLDFNAAQCPKFAPDSCSTTNCEKDSSGLFYKFRTIDLISNGLGKPVTIDVPKNHVSGTIFVPTYKDCCKKCAAHTGCSYWQWIPYLDEPCYMIKATIGKHCDKPTETYGTGSEAKNRQVLIGGVCNPAAGVVHDPHFTGAQGTHFDFSGLPDKSFCLLSDSRIHINILLRGYYDNRTEHATVITREGKAVRTWIREVGFIWTVDGIEHKVHMVARSGVEQTRGAGFMSYISVDGETLAVPALGKTLTGAGGFSLSLDSLEKSGPFDEDSFTLKIAGLLDMSVRMRVANPLLQSPTDAEAHFSLGINEVQKTDAIHGILGQTYRKNHADRAVKYSELSALLKAPVVADGESGKGFLDGEPLKDYMTSTVLTPDCTFASYSFESDNAVAAS